MFFCLEINLLDLDADGLTATILIVGFSNLGSDLEMCFFAALVLLLFTFKTGVIITRGSVLVIDRSAFLVVTDCFILFRTTFG